MDEHAVVIAGAGPTGPMLAGELVLADVDVVIVERRRDQHLDESRAGGLHSRTIEVLDQRGIADRFLAEGQQHPFAGYAGTFLDIGDFPTRHNYLLALKQNHVERILADWVLGELEVPTLRGSEVVGFDQDDTGVDVDLDTPGGPTRVFALLHDATPVLLNLDDPGTFDIGPWDGRVRMVDADCADTWDWPVIGEVAAPPAVLLCPDGHAAWVGEVADPGLPDALSRWFGAPTKT